MKVGVETGRSLGLQGPGERFTAKDSQDFQDLLGCAVDIHIRVIPRFDDQAHGVFLDVIHWSVSLFSFEKRHVPR
jgi:hypothetical protein